MFPQVFGKYVFEREIASGGMARVYLATLRGAGGFEKRLVVKQIRPELASDEGFVERFVKEAKTAVELSHPNIVPVFELGVEQGVYYIAMEHCDGSTLADVLKTTGPLDAEEGAHLGAEVCKALDFAYRRARIVHRDVTPRNVLVDEEGAVRIIDFGIAAPAAQQGDQGVARTEVFGSPGHMPPEQQRGMPLTPAADVYAVGVLLYEAWTGEPAFRRDSLEKTQAAQRAGLPSLAGAEESLSAFDQLLQAAVADDPKDRPQSAEQVAHELRAALSGADTTAIARRLGERVRRCRKVQPVRSKPSDRQSSGPVTPLADGRKATTGTRTFATNNDFASLTGQALPSTGSASGPGPTTRKLPSEFPPDENMARPSVPWLTPGRLVALGGVAALAIALSRWPEDATDPPRAAPVASVGVTIRPSAAFQPVSEHVPVRVPPSAQPVEPERAPLQSRSVRPPEPQPAPSQRVPSAPPGGTRSLSTSLPSVVSTLSLTALPQASVAVAGQVFSTPERAVRLPPGSYRVTFRNSTSDEPLSTQLVLKPGQLRHVHADFTTEPPKVLVR